MRSRRWFLVLALPASTLVACASDDDAAAESSVVEIVEQDEWGQVFEDENVVGTFAAREVGSRRTLGWDLDRVEQRQLPHRRSRSSTR